MHMCRLCIKMIIAVCCSRALLLIFSISAERSIFVFIFVSRQEKIGICKLDFMAVK